MAGAKAAAAAAQGRLHRQGRVDRGRDRPAVRTSAAVQGYLLGKEPRDKAYVHEAQWYAGERRGADPRRHRAGLDPAGHTITVDNVDPAALRQAAARDRVAAPALDVPGSDSDGIRYLRTIEESDACGRACARASRCWCRRRLDRPRNRRRRARGRRRRHRGRDGRAAAAPGARRRGGDRASATSTRPTARRSTSGSGCTSSATRRPGHPRGADRRRRGAGRPGHGRGRRPAQRGAGRGGGLEVGNGIVTDERLRTSDPDIYAAATSPHSCPRWWASVHRRGDEQDADQCHRLRASGIIVKRRMFTNDARRQAPICARLRGWYASIVPLATERLNDAHAGETLLERGQRLRDPVADRVVGAPGAMVEGPARGDQHRQRDQRDEREHRREDHEHDDRQRDLEAAADDLDHRLAQELVDACTSE